MGRALSIITGASRGLGLEVARALLQHYHKASLGHDLLLLGSKPENAHRASDHISQLAVSHGADVRVVGHGVDFSHLDGLESQLTRILTSAEQPGGLLPSPGGPAAYSHVLLIHSAGQVGSLVPLWDQELSNIRRQMDLNVSSPLALTSAVLREFMKQPAAKEITVVNVSSISAMQPYEAFGVYAAGKAARHMLTATLAREADMLWNKGHSVQAAGTSDAAAAANGNADSSGGQEAPRPRIFTFSYSPGPIDTDMQAGARESLPQGLPLKAAFERNFATKQLVDPADSARVLVELIMAPKDTIANGSHTDYYAQLARTQKGARHPLDYAASN